MVLELVSSSVRLTLRCASNAWCTVELADGNQSRRLGAETKEILVTRLIEGLGADYDNAAGRVINGVRMTCFMSLLDGHASLYAAETSTGRLLVVQGADGGFVGRIELSWEERLRWLELLKGWDE